MMSRASFGIVLSFGAVLFAIWPNILPLQQHLAMAQIIPGAARAPTFGSVPANTTAGAPANTTAEAPDPGDPAGEEAVPHWYGGAPCSDNSCHD
ncbi:MAG: hypothetical protein WBE34_21105 [Candidatus Nitrosopolaris sp.]